MEQSERIMEQKLANIFEFLLKHRQFNHKLQEKDYQSTLLWHAESDQVQKITSMFYDVANTQSQPRIDKLSSFYRYIWHNSAHLTSFKSFATFLNPTKRPSYESLFLGLKKQSGWGPKTSALFAKSIYHIHSGSYDPRLKIWDDAPKQITSQDKLYLPVDSVIIEIFKRLDERKWDFDSVNKCINEFYTGVDIEVWDDLWFWGFITQRIETYTDISVPEASVSGGISKKKRRVFEWNSNKYWALQCSDKSQAIESEVKSLSLEFLSLIR